MQTHARVVVIGGGMMGVGLLYHLAEEGWTDILLVEKGELTSRLDVARGRPVSELHRRLQHGEDP